MKGRYDAIVLGAGAAGLFCASVAGRRGRRVLVLEHNSEPGRKIVISGGGRCNFTNLDTKPDRFLSANPHFAKSALARYTPRDFLNLVERHGIPYAEKRLGQLFCEGVGSARRIVRMLLDECAAGDVDLRLGAAVTRVDRAECFSVEAHGEVFTAPALVLATGGLSIPKLGATRFSLDLAERFGLGVVTPAPALVPVTLAADDLAWTAPLTGVSTPVVARAGTGPAFAEAALFTHRGLSGPAILQASSYRSDSDAPLTLDLTPDAEPGFLRAAKRTRPKAGSRTIVAMHLPQRLAEALVPDDRPLADWKDAALEALESRLRRLTLQPAGDEGYAKAEVMRGGVDTRALSSKTMEAIAAPGLFVIGEAVDVTGWLGGYNFQWAWASGFAAGSAV